ncbi:Helix-turn-helix domain-containing protein [Nonomuraea solani]|uniref:Helix-turn-helix domain-containing protein n=1 Tax=Nonomuraea solani TaxID=1144553 RepID=A0A1H6DTR9_9ACTN|nr:helix-turn-helix domain-containing protein [Nonomuraea solani]SEG88629.1 Helix-turn-helix domain-containing protein [Nonomuraea solani]
MRTHLVIERLDRVPVKVSLAPGLSMLALISDALSGRERGAPERWRRRLRSAVLSPDEMVVQSLASPGSSVLPDFLLPGDVSRDLDVPTQLEMLRDLPADTLRHELQSMSNGQPPPHWQPALKAPRRWVHGYADLVEQAWSAMHPEWQQARALFDREVERVAVASARGALDVVLDDLHVDCTFREGTWSLPDYEPQEYSIEGKGLVLMPMLAGPNAIMAHLDGPDFVWIGYSLPHPTTPRATEEQLGFLFGDARATILISVDQPLSMGVLARRIKCHPSVITYHCNRLESAGLVNRRREGREIYVSRTERGTALLNLFSS